VKPFILKDFAIWKELNRDNDFSLHDYMFHVTKLNKVPSDIYFAFLEMFWPSFVVYKDYVILKESFSEEKIEDLIKQKENVEFWMNLFLTDSYFEDEENEESKAESLARSLVILWQTKLEKDFPSRNFIVKYLYDLEFGDYGLTFYQTDK
jgi:predicted CopG family antitoxin